VRQYVNELTFKLSKHFCISSVKKVLR